MDVATKQYVDAQGGGGGGGAPKVLCKYSQNPVWQTGSQTIMTIPSDTSQIDPDKYYLVTYNLNGYFTTVGSFKTLLIKMGSSVLMNMPFSGFADNTNFSFCGSNIIKGSSLIGQPLTSQLQSGSTLPVTTSMSGTLTIMEMDRELLNT